jgi:hypothetical protein
MTEHTPTPWAIGERERLIVREVPGMCDGGDCYSVAETKFHSLLLQDEAAANAAFIVRAANNHDALVDDLADAVKLLHDLLGLIPGSGEAAFAFVERQKRKEGRIWHQGRLWEWIDLC